MSNATVVFCEGHHDINFLTRLLSHHGFSPTLKTLKELPRPYAGLFEKQLQESKIEDKKFEFQPASEKTPFSILEKEGELLIFHNLSGDGGIVNKSKNVIDMYLIKNLPIARESGRYKEISFKFLYFMDADNDGVDARLEQIKLAIEADEVNHGVVSDHPSGDYIWGCYIFHNDQTPEKNGTLEDLLLQLMTVGNEQIFDDCRKFLEEKALPKKRTKEFKCIESKYKGGSKYKHKKSIIATAGQLQFSGSNSSMIIAKSDYIQKADLEGNSCCKRILGLFY